MSYISAVKQQHLYSRGNSSSPRSSAPSSRSSSPAYVRSQSTPGTSRSSISISNPRSSSRNTVQLRADSTPPVLTSEDGNRNTAGSTQQGSSKQGRSAASKVPDWSTSTAQAKTAFAASRSPRSEPLQFAEPPSYGATTKAEAAVSTSHSASSSSFSSPRLPLSAAPKSATTLKPAATPKPLAESRTASPHSFPASAVGPHPPSCSRTWQTSGIGGVRVGRSAIRQRYELYRALGLKKECQAYGPYQRARREVSEPLQQQEQQEQRSEEQRSQINQNHQDSSLCTRTESRSASEPLRWVNSNDPRLHIHSASPQPDNPFHKTEQPAKELSPKPIIKTPANSQPSSPPKSPILRGLFGFFRWGKSATTAAPAPASAASQALPQLTSSETSSESLFPSPQPCRSLSHDSNTATTADAFPDGEILSCLPQSAWREDCEACELCQQSFGFWRRRHHCRGCGKCVCARCSSARRSMLCLEPATSQDSWTQPSTPVRDNNAKVNTQLNSSSSQDHTSSFLNTGLICDNTDLAENLCAEFSQDPAKGLSLDRPGCMEQVRLCDCCDESYKKC
mmetsp:Transcript_10834/g.20585  ORF Transcript_10834/g.20585 Transcript_10834/m.20585 type:complete len:565 (-) Transcript_10834:130-1824(-)|eukprot:CAMPEP_0175164750 /NCGR_PEP_ID=MMETSP0087-20121206/26617_1 /TAXON_ID=136419 /ORGANISM="Unknown Unknown, Strain D1" /LENGTH=564 /DNA_ID=CAMNT_0016453877 /DNA_START=171 /DNA_END=1865 /DNA_ORIENTATION=+